jgi:hypothetical protein
MIVAIPCAACSATVELGSQACPACRRPLSSEELAALEARFEATSVDFRDTKNAFTKALAAALAAGLMTIAIHGMRVWAVSSDPELAASFAWGSTAGLAAGVALVGCWFAKRRAPILAVVAASIIWSASLVLPFVLTPVETILGMTSAAGVATTLVRVVVLFMLVRGIRAATQMRRLLLSRGS